MIKLEKKGLEQAFQELLSVLGEVPDEDQTALYRVLEYRATDAGKAEGEMSYDRLTYLMELFRPTQ